MKIHTHENIVNVYDGVDLIKSTKSFMYVLYPEAGHVLINKQTKIIYEEFVCLKRREDIENYEDC